MVSILFPCLLSRVIIGKEAYKKSSGSTINFLLKTSLITCDLKLLVYGHFALEKLLWAKIMSFFGQHVLLLSWDNKNYIDIPTKSDVCFFFLITRNLYFKIMFKLKNYLALKLVKLCSSISWIVIFKQFKNFTV